MYQERELSSKKIEFRVNNEYQIRQPKGTLAILDEQNNFIGFILSKPEKKADPKYILKKVGFKPVQAEVSIDFESKDYDLPSLDNLSDYCEKLEEFIDKLYFNKNIESGKLYIQENDKKFTFCKNADGRIRFHYEKAI
ncbi:30143_t:CDS:2 [Racocetra persica]|uniref:30143_t:CDS:1 n=1 Tax=Racocetra persica TaxID=160502 RepID=A0ACA9L1Y1_9GLOM|nr:30143_t:CDS:2 [Racocetra persica]